MATDSLKDDDYKHIHIKFNGESFIIGTSEDMTNEQMFFVLASVVKYLSEAFKISGKTEDTVVH
jgi:hypothetical protein